MRQVKPQLTFECRDRYEFERLTQKQVQMAHKITVGGVVVKNRNGPVGSAA
jgi:hypothetical protein